MNDEHAGTLWLMSSDQSDPALWLASILRRPEWHQEAACRGIGTDAFFPTTGRKGDTARAVCDTCTVRSECMAAALDDPDTVGVWAGTTDRDRKRMRRDTLDDELEPLGQLFDHLAGLRLDGKE
jgi:WhiB family redox-sensing transcriptional regulator